MTRWATGVIRNTLAVLALASWLAVPGFADDPVNEDESPAAAAEAEADADAGAPVVEASTDEEHGKTEHETEGEGHAGKGDHGDHAAEDPYDLSHSNALPTQDKPEEWKFDLAIYTFVVFFLLMAILLKFAWGPIMAALSQREQRVAQMIEDAEKSAAKAQQQLAAYEAKLADAHSEAEGIVTRAKDSAQEQADKILADAQESAEREKTRALAEIEQAKNEALGEVTQKSVDIALGLAKSVVGREINADDHSALIQDALAKFPT